MSDELIKKLGKVIEGDAFRDAVHIAVAPVVAAEKLWPGQQIGMTAVTIADGTTSTAATSAQPIGIVDPFLPHPVDVGTRFWMWLTPGTITSLRHEWEHPAFSANSPSLSDTEKSTEVALAWMHKFAEKHEYYPNYYTEGEKSVQLTAEQMVEAGREFLLSGEVYTQKGFESLRNEFDPEFWSHFAVITGMEVPNYYKESNPFSCNC